MFGFGVQNEEGQSLTEFYQENALVIANWSSQKDISTHGHHQMVNTEIRLIFFAAKDGEALYSQEKKKTHTHTHTQKPGADCGSDNKLLVAKFRFELKKVGNTTRPFIYDLNQILYYYTLEVMNRFKGLDLVD